MNAYNLITSTRNSASINKKNVIMGDLYIFNISAK